MNLDYEMPDAQLVVRNFLRSLIADSDTDFLAGVTVSTKEKPEETGTPGSPWIQVRTDGLVTDRNLNVQATIRLRTWAEDVGLAVKITNRAAALLMTTTPSRPHVIRNVNYIHGALPTEDPDTKTAEAFATVIVRLKPIPLT